MAGIGEASAIIAIAQLGIKFSKTIFEYAGEVKEAPKEIRRIGRDLCTTSERLEEIGRLINQNPTNHLFNEGGIASAARCSSDCNEIIVQVTGLLAKSGWVSGAGALQKKDLDISLLESLRWPFVRAKLASPQADLERVKASLSLLFNSAMANASSNPLQSDYALQIPKLRKWAEEATRKAENARRRSNYTTTNGGRPLQREVHWEDEQGGEDEEDAEMRQSFVEYRVSLIKEEEERRAQERAAYMQAEKEAKQAAEETARRAIEQKAIANYKKEQDDLNAHKSEREEKFKKELVQLGLEPGKIQTIIGTTSFQALEWDSIQQSQSRSEHLQVSKSEEDSLKEVNETSPMAYSRMLNGEVRPTRQWFARRFTKSQKPGSPYTEVEKNGVRNLATDHSLQPTQRIELWLVDLVSGHTMELAPSREWLRSKLEKVRYDEISHTMAKLKHPWRTAISDFLQTRNEQEPPHLMWKLCFIGLPRRVSKLPLFGHRRGDSLVRLVVCQQKLAEDIASHGPQLASSQPHALDNFASVNSETELSSKASTRSHKQVFKSALRHSSGREGRSKGREQIPESREVSFADDGGSEIQEDGFGTITIETEVIADEAPRGTTIIPNDLIPTSAFEELGLPWIPLPRGLGGDTRELNKIPKALTHSEIYELERITKAKILEGEVPWRKPPILKLEEREIKYVSSGQLQDRISDLQTQPAAAASAKDSGKQDFKPESNLANFSRVSRSEPADEQLSRLRRSEIIDEVGIPRPTENRGIETYYVESNGMLIPAAPRSSVRETEYLGPRSAYEHRNNDTHTYSIPTLQPGRYSEWDRIPRRRESPRRGESLDESSVRDGRRGLMEPRRPVPPVREEHEIVHRNHSFERKRPTYGDAELPRYREDRDEEIVIRNRERERPRYREEYEDEEIIIRDRERERPRYREERDEATVNRERERERPTYKQDEITVRRERSPKRIEYYKERDRGESYEEPAVAVRNRPREVTIRRDRFPDGFRHRGAGRNERSEYGPLVLRENRGRPTSVIINNDNSDPSWKRRFSNSGSETPGALSRSGTQRSFNDTDTYTDSTARPLHRESRSTFATEPTDEEVISSALKRFTTFRDETDNITASPTGIGSPELPLRAEQPTLTLQEAQRKLNVLLEKQERATKEGNLTTAADLQFYAIPDVRAQVEDLRAQEAKVKDPGLRALVALGTAALTTDRNGRAKTGKVDVEAREESVKGIEEVTGQASAGRSKVQSKDDEEEEEEEEEKDKEEKQEEDDNSASSMRSSDNASEQTKVHRGRSVPIKDADKENDLEIEQVYTDGTIVPQEARYEDLSWAIYDKEERKNKGMRRWEENSDWAPFDKEDRNKNGEGREEEDHDKEEKKKKKKKKKKK